MARVPFAVTLLLAAALPAQQFSTAARQQDLDFVANQVPRLHANFFFQLDPAVYQQAVAALQAQIATLSDSEFYVRLAALVAMAGDAHTLIYLNNEAAANAGFQLLPVQFRWLDDGVFVTAASAPYSQALGARLIQVGNFSIDQVMQKMATVISHANDQWLHYSAAQYLSGLQILQGLDLLPAGSPVSLTFQTLGGTEFALQFRAVSAGPLQPAVDPAFGPIQEFLQQPNTNYWYTYSAANRTLYFKYNRCANDPANPFSSFAASVLATLDSQPVDTLVLDFRGNTGGSSSLIDPLALGLVSRLPSLLANPQFRIYDVIDKGTFSSGMDDAMAVKLIPTQVPQAAGRVVVIGEPTGGKPAEYGEVVSFILPASGLVGQYSTQFHPLLPGIQDLPSFVPDVPVGTRSTDFLARFDPVFAAMLARRSGTPPAPSGNVLTVNGASFRVDQGLAPGSIATAFGTFAQTPDQVTVNGVPGRLFGANSGQANFLIPDSVSPGSASISVRAGGAELANGQATITVAGPGIFVLQGANPAQPGAVENQDYSVNSSSNPAAPGTVVQIFATGDGPLAASAQVFFADIPAQVLFSGDLAPYPGLWQINAVVPPGLSGQIPVFITAGNLTSNAATLWVH